jgi:hypothetical protein
MPGLKALIPHALKLKFVLAATSIALTVVVMALAAPVALTMGVVAISVPAEAQSSPWCSRRKGVNNCMYQTQQQCRASISGRGGSCVRRRS